MGIQQVGFGGLALAVLPAWAQEEACRISLAYEPMPSQVAAVPGLGTFSLGMLAAALAVLAWRRKAGAKVLSAGLLAVATVCALQSGGSLIGAVSAAGPYELNDAQGGTLVDETIAYASPAPLLTVVNTSGVRLRISGNDNAEESGSCIAGLSLAPGASCTTQAVCTAPPTPSLMPLAVTQEPVFGCEGSSEGPPWDENEPPLDFAWGWIDQAYREVANFAPKLVTPPGYDPSMELAGDFTYERDATEAERDENNNLLNHIALGSGTSTYTVTAPEGYGFGENLEPTKTWTSPYYCQVINHLPN